MITSIFSFKLFAAYQCTDLFSVSERFNPISEEAFLKSFRQILGIKVDPKKTLSARIEAQKEILELEEIWGVPYSFNQREELAFDFFRQRLSENFFYIAYGPEGSSDGHFLNRSYVIDAFGQSSDSSISQSLQKSRLKLTDFWFSENSGSGLLNPIQDLQLTSIYSFYVVRYFFHQSEKKKEMATLRVLKRTKNQPTVSEIVLRSKGVFHKEFEDFLRKAEQDQTAIYELGRISNAISHTKQISQLFRLILHYEFGQLDMNANFLLSVKNHPKLIEYYKKWGFEDFEQTFVVDGIEYKLMKASAQAISSTMR